MSIKGVNLFETAVFTRVCDMPLLKRVYIVDKDVPSPRSNYWSTSKNKQALSASVMLSKSHHRVCVETHNLGAFQGARSTAIAVPFVIVCFRL